MAWRRFSYLLSFALLLSIVRADDRIYFPDDADVQRNTPPQLTSNPARPTGNDGVQSRFLPFSASFSLGSGSDNAHSVSIGGTKDGISLSQSSSLSDSSSLSASQSSSFSAGLSGISASDAHALNVDHPLVGETSRADSNSFSLGEASASSHGKVENGRASTGAESAVGSQHNMVSSGASSSAGNGEVSADAGANAVQENRPVRNRPSWLNLGQNRPSVIPGIHFGLRPSRLVADDSNLNIGVTKFNRYDDSWPSGGSDVIVTKWRPNRDRPWQNVNCGNRGRFSNFGRNAGCGGQVNFVPESSWNQNQYRPNPDDTRISAASANSGASSSGNGFSFGQSISQGSSGLSGPSSSTTNHVQTVGNAESHAQGAAAGVQQNSFGQGEASFSSGAISGNSMGNGQSVGSAISNSRGGASRGQVDAASSGTGSIQGSANAGTAAIAGSPNFEREYIPDEFVRSYPDENRNIERSRQHGRRGPVGKLLTDLEETVSNLFDI